MSRSGQRWQLRNDSGDSRLFRVVFEDGSFEELQLEAEADLEMPARF